MKHLITIAALLAGAAAVAADDVNLRVIATNVKSDQGKLYVWVYDKKDDWLSDRYRTRRACRGGQPPGRQGDSGAAAAGRRVRLDLQDVNDDGKLGAISSASQGAGRPVQQPAARSSAAEIRTRGLWWRGRVPSRRSNCSRSAFRRGPVMKALYTHQ
jgi:uncharacterized protein (DUF2141 family)